MKSQRKICEQPHVALAVRVCGGRRKRVRQQPVVIWLAEKIAPKQLECVRDALHFFDRMRERAPIIIHFVRAGGMGEVRFVAVIWENCQNENQDRGEPNDD